MTDFLNPVVPIRRGPSEPQYRDALIAGLARAAANIGRGIEAGPNFYAISQIVIRPSGRMEARTIEMDARSARVKAVA